MDVLKDKAYEQYDYLSRYSSVPYYYHTEDQREIYGIGSNMNKDIEFISHKVKQNDTLDKLALKYYNNPTLWWIIAYFNDIQDAFINIFDEFEFINIPTMTQVFFEDPR